MVRIPDSTSLMGRDVNMRTASNPVTGVENSIPAGLEGLSRGVAKVGDELYAAAKEQERDQDTLDLTKAQSYYNSRMVELDKRFNYENDQDYATWSNRYREEAGKVRQEALGMISSQKRRGLFNAKLDGDIFQRGLAVQERSQGVARQLGREQLNQSLDQQIATATDPAIDPARSEKIMAETRAAIDSAIRTGMMTPAEGEQSWQRAKQRRADIQIDREIDIDPEAAMVRLGGGQIMARAGRAMQILQAKGWSPVQAAGMVGRLFQESNLNTNARNPGDGRDGSDSIGINQWNSQRARNLKAFAAERGKDWTDFDTQVEFIDHELRTSEKSAAAMLAGATTPEDAARAAMSFARPAGWRADAPEQGHGFENTLKKTRLLAAGKAGGYYADLTPEQRERFASRAESAMVRRDSETRAQTAMVSGLIVDDYNSIRSTGQEIPGLDRERVESLLGRVEAEKFERERRNARTFYDATKDFDALPNNQIMARIESARPSGGTEGFTEAQKNYEEVAKKGAAIIDRRNADPAAAVESLETVRKAREAAEYEGEGMSRRIRSESAQAIIRARLAAQEALGIERPYAVSRSESRVIVRQLRGIGDDAPDELRQFMQSLRQTYGVFADQVLASSLELQSANRELSNVATKVLGAIAVGTIPDISSIRQLDAMIEWGSNNTSPASPVPADPYQGTAMEPSIGMAMDPYQGMAMGAGPPQQPALRQGVTYDARDVQWLFENRNDKTAIAEFEAKYGAGTGDRVLKAYESRIEAQRRK